MSLVSLESLKSRGKAIRCSTGLSKCQRSFSDVTESIGIRDREIDILTVEHYRSKERRRIAHKPPPVSSQKRLHSRQRGQEQGLRMNSIRSE
jgi:hypothetical protein